jgi:hypothetical protein
MIRRTVLLCAALAGHPLAAGAQWKVDSSAVDPMEDRLAVRASLIADEGSAYQLTITCTSDRTLIGVMEGTEPFMPTSVKGGSTLTSIRVRFDKTRPVGGNLIVSGTLSNVAGLGDLKLPGLLRLSYLVSRMRAASDMWVEITQLSAQVRTHFTLASNTVPALRHIYKSCGSGLP